ncbi:hypothetical protein PFISCL1PPCAC_28751, partial [Pristionchus fissidentatus]
PLSPPPLSPPPSLSSLLPSPSLQMDDGGISLRTFSDSNRLRPSERLGDSLLHSIEMNGNCIGVASSSRASEAFPSPPNERSGFIEHLPHRHEEEGDDEVSGVFHNSAIIPSRQQVLFYLSSSSAFHVMRADREIQITDTASFPLFDIWAEKIWCGGSLWVMESYGRRVLFITDSSQPSTLSRRRPIATQSVTDWNDTVIAYFLPGDPFLIQNAQRETIIRCNSMCNVDGRRDTWECILEEAGREAARLENGLLRFTPHIGFQLKLLIVAALSRALTTPRSSRSCFSFLR